MKKNVWGNKTPSKTGNYLKVYRKYKAKESESGEEDLSFKKLHDHIRIKSNTQMLNTY